MNDQSKTIPKGQPVEFELPDNATLPEQSDPNKDIDLVCSFRVKGGRTLCMTKWGETQMPLPDYAGDQKETKPDYSSMVPSEDAGPMGGQGGGGVGMSSMAGY